MNEDLGIANDDMGTNSLGPSTVLAIADAFAEVKIHSSSTSSTGGGLLPLLCK